MTKTPQQKSVAQPDQGSDQILDLARVLGRIVAIKDHKADRDTQRKEEPE